MITNFNEYLFHASSLGKVMTDSRTKEQLGETCKAHLLECYIAEKYGRHKEIKNKYIEKGIAAEEDSLTLYSRVTKKPYFKNKELFKNDFFVGTPDIIEDDKIIDIKTSWDIHTFFAVLHKPINSAYEWQLQAYMDLTGKKHATLVYCLVNTPEHLINDAKRKLSWEMGVIDPDANELYQEACLALEREMIFDDIPIKERYIEFSFEYDEKRILASYEKIKLCRGFLAGLK